MVSSNKNVWYLNFIPFIILILTWSFLGGWITIFSRQWIWVVLGSFIVAVSCPSFFATKQMLYLVLYFLVVLINLLTGDTYYNSPVKVLYEVFLLLFSSGISFCIVKGSLNDKTVKWILWIGAFVIIFTSLATYLVDQLYPGVVRNLVVFNNQGLSFQSYFRMGVCDYTMPHAIPILIAPLVMLIKNKRIKSGIRLLSAILLTLVFLLVFVSGTTTPLMISLIAFFCAILVNQKKSFVKNITRIVIFALFMTSVLNKDIQLSIINSLEKIIPETNSNYKKIADFEALILYEETSGDLAERQNLYNESILSFWDNLLLGVDDAEKLGGHSILLDKLGSIGLVGTIPYLLFIWLLVKSVYLKIAEENKVYYCIAVGCFLATLGLKNMDGTWMWIALCVFLPLMMFSTNNVTSVS